MPVTITYLSGLDILIIDLTPRVSGKFATEGSLEIAKLDQSHWGIRIASQMARLRYQEFHHLLLISSHIRIGGWVRYPCRVG